MTRTEKQFKGDAGEAFIRQRYILVGYRCTLEKSTNEGFDFVASKSQIDGTVERIWVEVKAGKHGLSPAQLHKKEDIERHGEIYKHEIVYVPKIYYGEIMRKLWPNGLR